MPGKLSLIRPANEFLAPSRVYSFDLCDRCSTLLFAWIGEDAKNSEKSDVKCGIRMEPFKP